MKANSEYLLWMLVKCVIIKPLTYTIVSNDATTAVGRFSAAVNIDVRLILKRY